MKRIIILSFVMAAVMFFGLNVNSTARIKYQSRPNGYSDIHYQVNIHPNFAITHNGCPLMVSLTDGSGMAIGQPQLFHPGTNTYNFYEMGPASGTRIAKLGNVEEGQADNVCRIISITDSKSGNFMNGLSYLFDLRVREKTSTEPKSPIAQ